VRENVLTVRDLAIAFPSERGRVPVVDGVDLELSRGEALALVGESGCGKSLTALSVMRLVPRPGRITRGAISLDGRDVLALRVSEMRRLRGHQVAMIFQEPMTSLNPVVTAGAQVVEAIRLHEPMSASEARRRGLALFEQVGIPDPSARFDAYPHQLSGGMKQRVMIAMALAMRPRLLIADEPTTALDVTIQAQILELMRELRRELGTAILLITHDFGVVNELADRVAVMYAGRVLEEGTREEVLSSPRQPYTHGLLRSMPSRARAGERLAEIPGSVPRPGEWPSGCRFRTRCERAFARCAEEDPARVPLGGLHTVWCHAVAADEGRT
jgi:oligopeptide/dipeptide ABC transporter ATP-binding protein